jgi:hypothetical protein
MQGNEEQQHDSEIVRLHSPAMAAPAISMPAAVIM